MEAIESKKAANSGDVRVLDLLSKDPNIRRMVSKNIFFRLPARPLIKFLYYYFIRLGVLDGKPGLDYCLLQSFYELLIVLKAKEIKSEV